MLNKLLTRLRQRGLELLSSRADDRGTDTLDVRLVLDHAASLSGTYNVGVGEEFFDWHGEVGSLSRGNSNAQILPRRSITCTD